MMRIACRTDASTRIGGGHVARCLQLARALRAQGADVFFLCRKLEGHAGSSIAASGFPVHFLPHAGAVEGAPAQPGSWGRQAAMADAAACCALVTRPLDWLIVDHYGVDASWERAMRPATRHIMVVDDLANRAHACDMLLDQNLLPGFLTRYRKLVPADCRCLLGPRFVLVADPFRVLASQARVRHRVRRLLVFFGCGDPDNLTGRAVRELDDIGIGGDVVVGRANPHREQIQTLCAQAKSDWNLHVQTDKMAALMQAADLMIGAGGTTHWERCLLGLPAVTVAVAENQVAVTRMLASEGTCLCLGAAGLLPEGAILRAVLQLKHDAGQLEDMCVAARAIVPDGEGKNRVCAAMLAGG